MQKTTGKRGKEVPKSFPQKELSKRGNGTCGKGGQGKNWLIQSFRGAMKQTKGNVHGRKSRMNTDRTRGSRGIGRSGVVRWG